MTPQQKYYVTRNSRNLLVTTGLGAYHVTRNSQNLLVTTGLGACCYTQSNARGNNAAAYGLHAKHSGDMWLSKYVKVCFIGTIITIVTDVKMLVTRNYRQSVQ